MNYVIIKRKKLAFQRRITRPLGFRQKKSKWCRIFKNWQSKKLTVLRHKNC